MPSYIPGSRVRIIGLVSKPELNGITATVLGQAKVEGDPPRVPVALDKGGAIKAKEANLEPAEPTEAPMEDGRIPCLDGRMLDENGKRYIDILSTGQYIANLISQELPHLDNPSEMTALRRTPQGMNALQALTGQMWTYWEKTPIKGQRPVYEGVVELIEQSLRGYAVRGGLASRETQGSRPAVPIELVRLQEDVIDGEVSHWGASRISGDFIVVEQTPAGTILLGGPDADSAQPLMGPRARLYLVLGQANGIGQMLAKAGMPMPVVTTLTILPFGGRLVYDSLVHSLPRPLPDEAVENLRVRVDELVAEHGPPQSRGSPMPDPAAHAKWVEGCIDRARERAAAGEASGGSVEDGPKRPEKNGIRQPELPLEGWQKEVADRVKGLPQMEDSHASMWIMRRFGYTEGENPEHMVMPMKGNGMAAGPPFATAALEPTAEELAKKIADLCVSGSSVPQNVAIDVEGAVEEVGAALAEAGVYVGYYPPPSAEETRNINSLPPRQAR